MKVREDQGDNEGLNPPEEFPEDRGDDNYWVIDPNGVNYWVIDANGVWQRRQLDDTEDECVDR